MRIQDGCLLFSFSALILSAGTVAQEQRIRRSDLPLAVEKTVSTESRGAAIRGLSKEKEKDGATLYEVELVIDGHGRDVTIDETGKVVEVEEQVSLDSLSAAVKDGIHAKAGEGKILNVESISKNGNLVAYEAKVTKAGKKFEVQVGPDGRALDHPE